MFTILIFNSKKLETPTAMIRMFAYPPNSCWNSNAQCDVRNRVFGRCLIKSWKWSPHKSDKCSSKRDPIEPLPPPLSPCETREKVSSMNQKALPKHWICCHHDPGLPRNKFLVFISYPECDIVIAAQMVKDTY